MPLRPGKLREIDVVARHHVLLDGTVLNVDRLDGLHFFELVLPKANGFRIGEIVRNTVHHSFASFMGEKIGQNSKAFFMPLDRIEQHRRGIGLRSSHFSDRADLQITTRALNDFELTEFF